MTDLPENLHQSPDTTIQTHDVVVIGGGPAGLMAAEQLCQAGLKVVLYDAMPTVGRKFLLAGKGGLNITHGEELPLFLSRYGARQTEITALMEGFSPAALRAWIHGLGIDTFIGSSNRVFPKDMKAAPLLRAWLHRLRAAGTTIFPRHRFVGWSGSLLEFDTPAGRKTIAANATVLALGGASWARLGSDGAWVPWLQQAGIEVAPLKPANCGFERQWSEHFRSQHAATPVKSVRASLTTAAGETISRVGEFMITEQGVEGSLIYALSSHIRDTIMASGSATLLLDLLPDRSQERVQLEVCHPRGSRSLSSHLQSRSGITGVKAGLLRELLDKQQFQDPATLAMAIKSLQLQLDGIRPADEAISSAGGVMFEALDGNQMMAARPGVFCAGEMLDWEAPTGGYLLTACLASGRRAGLGALAWLMQKEGRSD